VWFVDNAEFILGEPRHRHGDAIGILAVLAMS
jgi:hypothetical protein